MLSLLYVVMLTVLLVSGMMALGNKNGSKRRY